MITRTDQLATWRREAAELCQPVCWRPFWRPRMVVQRGHVSPWFLPFLWPAKSGAFTLFFLLIVSGDLLHCSPPHRRAIIAHECGHLGCFHTLIWALAVVFVLRNAAIRAGFAWIGTHQGPLVALGTFLANLGLILVGFRALLYWFEYQADDYAVARVGAADLVAALSWLGTATFGAEASP